jgi:hypothetical protein
VTVTVVVVGGGDSSDGGCRTDGGGISGGVCSVGSDRRMGGSGNISCGGGHNGGGDVENSKREAHTRTQSNTSLPRSCRYLGVVVTHSVERRTRPRASLDHRTVRRAARPQPGQRPGPPFLTRLRVSQFCEPTLKTGVRLFVGEVVH